jgi:anti-sigma regulatory factor (Ser/Thr protein kinase)/ActR/RegA family two-component response regulator
MTQGPMSFASPVETQPNPAKTALIVDADHQVGELLARILDPETWSIQHAADNRAALALAEARAFDLILTGEKTSGREDVELLRKIRRVRPHTRLIILTDESTPADVVASMRHRAFSYFSKPFSLDSLAGMVRIATEGPCWDDGIEVLSATPALIHLLARCDLKTADRLLQFLREIADLPDAEKEAVATAFREMLHNAIEHGGHFDPNQYVEISYLSARHVVMCRVKDPGEGFSLEEIRHAAIANPPDDPIRHVTYREAQGLRAGGFGVLLARNLVDELIYGEKGNEVHLIKYLGANTLRPG